MEWLLELLAVVVEPLGLDKNWVAIVLTVLMTALIVGIGVVTLR